MSLTHKSQSALEYMMTYGWAILVIVIVAAVLYSLGIFSPSSSLSTTITGFSGLAVTQAGCVNSLNNQILELYVTNAVGYPVNITKINTTGNNGIDASQNVSSILGDGNSAVFYVNGACNKSSSYAGSATITYIEPGQIFPGPYLSTGRIINAHVNSNPDEVAYFDGNAQILIRNPKNEPSGSQPITAVVWFNSKNIGSGEVHFLSFGQEVCTGHAFTIGTVNNNGTGDFVDTWCTQIFTGTVLDNTQYLGVAELNNTHEEICLRQLVSGSSFSCAFGTITPDVTGNSQIYIGSWPARPNYTGTLENIQLYNYNLNTAQMNEIYSEGMGGAPIPNAGLVAWWPLDGNANDYSGNNNNGVAYNVQWVSP